MSIGAFASNGKEVSKLNEAKVETIQNIAETFTVKVEDDVLKAEIVVNCEDGSSYNVSCDSCSTSQLIGIAYALCS
ncbi:MAG: hypothetical protein JJE07_02880 [Flavobacteriaceae bacterium]|nr:hypothetical protein [Flavobacteriaceae bacterium]